MNIYQIRKANLAALLGPDRGKAAELEDKFGVDASYLSQLKNGHRRMGEKAARKLEADLRLPEKYFDRPVGLDENAVTLEDVEATLSRADWLSAQDREIVIGFLRGRAK